MSTSPVANCNRLQRSLSAEDLTEKGKALISKLKLPQDYLNIVQKELECFS